MNISAAMGICIVVFIAMMIFPFVPGWIELRRRQDVKHLNINAGYVRNPRYFSDSFKKKLLAEKDKLADIKDERNIMLSHEETVVCGDVSCAKQSDFPHIVVFYHAATTLPHSVFHKEIYAKEQLVLRDHTLVRAAACEEDCTVGPDSRIIRWIDAEKSLNIGKNCRLDLSATAGEYLILGQGCSFHRLYAPKICIAGDGNDLPDGAIDLPLTVKRSMPIDYDTVYRDVNKIEKRAEFFGHIIARGDFSLEAGAVLVGSLKVYGNLHMAEGSRIYGNVFSDKNIDLASGSCIDGSVFTQGELLGGPGCCFGHRQCLTSVVARQKIIFGPNTVVYGYVSTEGRGETA